MDELEDHVFKADPKLAICRWEECSDRGQYPRCYFNDLFIICPRYLTHRNYLKTIREMKNERRFRKKGGSSNQR